ncbi:peptide methionine sulfoxide reductase A5 [Macadamia integrifolia]|uniref:peptide methionine sulfoxide reductase A5 n=1 Tax=Macadamia integrifolia TaxID=60698 RepID=UPI001C4E50B2|nr:peptide methionine sulfoxide reductase A5 [Macadamia integrifolia]
MKAGGERTQESRLNSRIWVNAVPGTIRILVPYTIKGEVFYFWNICRENLYRSFSQTKQMRVTTRDLAFAHLLGLALLCILASNGVLSIRLPDRVPVAVNVPSNQPLKTAVFALGSFWRSEAVFGCLNGVVRTTAGYAGGIKLNPEIRSGVLLAAAIYSSDDVESNGSTPTLNFRLGFEHINISLLLHLFRITYMYAFVNAPQIEYDPKLIHFRQLLEVFWSNHDSRQVFGQGPDVGSQYRSVIFTNGTEEVRLAALSKEREQTKSKSSIVTTEIQQLVTFYPAEPEHQKFELKRKPFLLQLIGNMPEEELAKSSLAARLNSYAAELCPLRSQRQIDAKISEILRKGWPVLREV